MNQRIYGYCDNEYELAYNSNECVCKLLIMCIMVGFTGWKNVLDNVGKME